MILMHASSVQDVSATSEIGRVFIEREGLKLLLQLMEDKMMGD